MDLPEKTQRPNPRCPTSGIPVRENKEVEINHVVVLFSHFDMLNICIYLFPTSTQIYILCKQELFFVHYYF